jgi:hypothetical protein
MTPWRINSNYVPIARVVQVAGYRLLGHSAARLGSALRSTEWRCAPTTQHNKKDSIRSATKGFYPNLNRPGPMPPPGTTQVKTRVQMKVLPPSVKDRQKAARW